MTGGMMRKAFEAWMKSQNPKYKPTDDSMVDRLLWTTWQAATERAAKVCEEKHANGNWKHDTRHEFAAAIRGA
mgnify:FL=1